LPLFLFNSPSKYVFYFVFANTLLHISCFFPSSLGMLMTPPSSPPLSNAPTSHPTGLTRSLSHSGASAVGVSSSLSQNNSNQQQLLLIPSVPNSTAAAIVRTVQAAHSWRPQEAGRLGEQAWQDSLLAPVGLVHQPRSSDSAAPSTVSTSNLGTSTVELKDQLPATLWDFVDPTVKNSCICAK
jgi:hypothetical protein